MNVLIAPDSFKGSLTSIQAAEAMRRGLWRACPQAQAKTLPLSDGGEGFVASVLHGAGGSLVETTVTGPAGDPVSASFGVLPGGKTAVLEMAAASGLLLVPAERRNPLRTTTYGTGELIRRALDLGCRKLYVGLGGSATNDGGAGMAQALGFRFRDRSGAEIPPGVPGWMEAASIDASGADPRLREAEIVAACDVETPLYGPEGASAVFGPQKGATPEMAVQLDEALRRLASLLERDLGIDVHALAGGGAAGGLGAGLRAFCGARLLKGADFVLDLCGFQDALNNAELVLTGEGNTDGQTALGKIIAAIAERASRRGIPVIVLSGGLGEGYRALRVRGVTACFSAVPRPSPLEEAMGRAGEWLEDAAEEIARIYLAGRRAP